MPELLANLQLGPDAQVRQLAAVLLRKRIARHWPCIPLEVGSGACMHAAMRAAMRVPFAISCTMWGLAWGEEHAPTSRSHIDLKGATDRFGFRRNRCLLHAAHTLSRTALLGPATPPHPSHSYQHHFCINSTLINFLSEERLNWILPSVGQPPRS